MAWPEERRPSRRRLLRDALALSTGSLCGLDQLLLAKTNAGQSGAPSAAGKMVGTVEFGGESRAPMGETLGEELDGRRYTDLSSLKPDDAVSTVEQFYIRTRASTLLQKDKPWVVRVRGEGTKALDVSMEQIGGMAKPMGRHLMECAGNARSVHFGMLSVADWRGVAVADVLALARANSKAERVLISGFDTYSAASSTSIAGASWVFTKEQLEDAGAFFATEMNGGPLTLDHGWPVRLLVPGWYGCACIKWVDEIRFTSDRIEATSQMQEYAGRTMQQGVPKLAREYTPAILEQAAMPIRIEKWLVEDKLTYRVAGILWGGSVPVRRLQIRFNPEEEYVDVREFRQTQNDPWSFWSHVWMPKEPGSYLIRLRVAEPAITARRLDAGYYMRSVEIAEV